MEQVRQQFIAGIEEETKRKVSDIQWIYGKGDLADGDIFYCDCALQLTIKNSGYITIAGGSYCTDINNIIGSLVGYFEIDNSYCDLNINYDIDKIMSLMSEYYHQFSDSKEKPFLDRVNYEVI